MGTKVTKKKGTRAEYIPFLMLKNYNPTSYVTTPISIFGPFAPLQHTPISIFLTFPLTHSSKNNSYREEKTRFLAVSEFFLYLCTRY